MLGFDIFKDTIYFALLDTRAYALDSLSTMIIEHFTISDIKVYRIFSTSEHECWLGLVHVECYAGLKLLYNAFRNQVIFEVPLMKDQMNTDLMGFC